MRQPHPVAGAGAQAAVIEVIARVVHHAAALAQRLAHAIAYQQIADLALFQEEGEVLAAGYKQRHLAPRVF